jgi:hypothetical protein
VYDGNLIRQNDDLIAETLRHDGEITLSKTTYFSLLLTNYMQQGVRLGSTGQWIQHPRDLIDDGHGVLRSLSDSQLANPVGISTLAFTTDGKVVVILQSSNNESASGELAPSGSGSLDLRDVNRKLGHRERLVDVIAHGMERELCEEAGVKPDEIDWTFVLGYFRWMNKGAKPEYVGVTKLNKHSRELKRRPVNLSETRFVAGRAFGTVDLTTLRHAPESPDALVVDDLPGRVSFPLFMCLRAIGSAMARGGVVGERIERLA